MDRMDTLVRRPRPRAERPDRKQAILLAAERLFAQHGYHAVSIRQIADEAGVPLALVNYHHGQKHLLFHAIFDHWSGMLRERLDLLEIARAGDKAGRLQRVVEAFVMPVLRLRASAEGESYALLVARELAYRTPESERVLADYFDPLAHAFIDALQAIYPQRSRGEAAWAYQFALGTLIHHISDSRVERLSKGQNKAADAAAAPALLRFIQAGIDAALAQASPRRKTSSSPPRRRPTP